MALVIDWALIAAIFVGLILALGLNLNVQSDRNGALNVKVDGRFVPLSELAEPQIVVEKQGGTTITTSTTAANIGLYSINSVVKHMTTTSTSGLARTTSSSYYSVNSNWLSFIFLYGLWLIYGSLLELTPLRATIGKLAMSIRVAGEEGGRATPLSLIFRNLLKPASTAPLLIGFLIAAFTSRKQTLHDAVAGCVVIPRTQKT